MEMTYFGHSTFQIQTEDITLLFDPFFTDNPHTDVTPDQLSPDVILLTHAHFDHFADTPAFLEHGDPLVISNFEITNYVAKNHGHENSFPLNEGGNHVFDWGYVESVHARHTSSFPDGSYGGVPAGFVLDIDGQIIYNAGDTAPFAEMQWIGEVFDVDVMLAPIGNVFTMGIDGALFSAEMVDPQLFVPLHYDTFPPIEVDMDEFKRVFDESGFETKVFEFGETAEL